MSVGGSGVRLRLLLGLLGAQLLVLAVLSVAALLLVRDALYERRLADARQDLRAVAALAQSHCPAADLGCFRLAAQGAEGLRVLPPGTCARPLPRESGRALVCEEAAGAAFVRTLALRPVADQLRALDRRLFGCVAAALLLLAALSAWIVERGVVRRLLPVGQALAWLGEGADGEAQLLSEGGDALGRVGGAVNRLVERLRAERARTREQIISLQGANRLLAEEKRALREAREDLARSERLATVGRLAAGVAHEVGNPLAAILGYAGILRSRLPPGEGGAEYAERIEREAARMDRILRDLLDLARPRAERAAALDLGQIVRQAHALVAPQASWGGCALRAELPEGLPRALGVEHYAVQVLVNLLLNSARAKARAVVVRGEAEERFVHLCVDDDGEGIPESSFPRLFEPFFTTAAPGQGTGLGLALCHASMERMGGSIAAEARPPGSGARFVLRFPRADAQA